MSNNTYNGKMMSNHINASRASEHESAGVARQITFYLIILFLFSNALRAQSSQQIIYHLPPNVEGKIAHYITMSGGDKDYYAKLHSVDSGYYGISIIEHSRKTCTVDDSIAYKSNRGISLHGKFIPVILEDYDRFVEITYRAIDDGRYMTGISVRKDHSFGFYFNSHGDIKKYNEY